MNIDDQINATELEMRGLEAERNNIDLDRKALHTRFNKEDKALVDRAYEINGELRKLAVLHRSLS